MQMNGATITVKLLERQGIRIVSGIPGGANLPLYDALLDSPITHVLARHEQGAAFIAQGMARTTGRAAVCFATSGPGATNLLTAIADARADSIPLVAITGQVHSALMGRDAFQEVDTYGLCLPITKHTFMVRSPQELLDIIPEAFRIAETGRPGPVVVDIPKDVQTATLSFDNWPGPHCQTQPVCPLDQDLIRRLAGRINRAQRPVILSGGGVTAADAAGFISKLANIHSIPVATTLMGLGTFPTHNKLSLGFIGMHGSRYANNVMDAADLVIAVGARFGDRATGRVDEFCSGAEIIHIDIDAKEFGKIKQPALAIRGDIKEVIEGLLPFIEPNDRPDWLNRLKIFHGLYAEQPASQDDLRDPSGLIRAIAEHADKDAVITTDVGQHQMWTAQNYPFSRPRSFLTSGGLGTMGFGLPAAIGAALARPERQVICISGDGSIYMNIQELATLAELGLNVKVIVMNNNHLGLVRQQQELFFNGRYHASLARAFGLRGIDLGADASATLAQALEQPGPLLVDAPIHAEANVYPMVPPGAANGQMIGGKTGGCCAGNRPAAGIKDNGA